MAIKIIKTICRLKGMRMLCRIIGRPAQIEEDLKEIRRATDEAEKVMQDTKATLDGEELWFRGESKKDE